MKKILLIFCFLLISITSFGQYEKVFIDSTKSQTQIFGKTQEFISKTFNSAKSVIDLADASNGELISKGVLNTKLSGTAVETYTHATIEFISKDGKCKMIISNIYIEYTSTIITYKTITEASEKGKKRYINFLSDLENEISQMQSSFEKLLTNNNF